MKLLSDTEPWAAERLIERWRNASPEEKLAEVARLNKQNLALAEARMDLWYPNDPPERRRMRLLALSLGREIMLKKFGWDPEVEGW